MGLQDKYTVFTSPTPVRSSETVVNEHAGKDDEWFRHGLFQVFQECQRVLRDDGIVAFTFHHEKPEAWGAVLQAVLDAHFDIKSVWTYHSEKVGGAHGGGIRFDTIIVCRKRLREAEPAAWGQLKDEIVSAVQAELKRLLFNGAALSTEDVFVIVMGKALSVYSRHYPKVMREGQPILLSQAINEIEELVDEQIDVYFGMIVPPWLDMVSRVYLQHLARRPAITRDNLVKACRTRNIDFAELEHDYRYIKRGKGAGTYVVLLPDDRLEWLEEQVEDDPDTLTPIDRAHYLFALYRANRPVRPEIPRVYSDGLEEVCEALYHITRDKAYVSVAKEVTTMKDQGLLHR